MCEKAWDVILLNRRDDITVGVMAMPAGQELPEWAVKVLSATMPRQPKAAALIKHEFAKRGMTVLHAEPQRKIKEGQETRWFWQVVTETHHG